MLWDLLQCFAPPVVAASVQRGAEQIVLIEMFDRLAEIAKGFDSGLCRQTVGKGAGSGADNRLTHGCGTGKIEGQG